METNNPQEEGGGKMWELPYTPWKTQAAYFSWIRGGIRKLWSRHPVKVEAKKRLRERRPATLKNGSTRDIWMIRCNKCCEWLPQNQVEVDHLRPASSLKEWGDIQGFMERLLDIELEDVQLLCKNCHRIKSYADKQGISFNDAKITKAIINLTRTAAVAKLTATATGIPYKNVKQVREELERKWLSK